MELWRKRLVQHLNERGELYVKGGKLGVFKDPILLSPNFPDKSKIKNANKKSEMLY